MLLGTYLALAGQNPQSDAKAQALGLGGLPVIPFMTVSKDKTGFLKPNRKTVIILYYIKLDIFLPINA